MRSSTVVRTTALSALALGLLAGPLHANTAPLAERPIVIAHRGASGYLPEETMASYRLAVQMGADFIEPDLFMTADGVLVARHDRSLNATTNVVDVAAGDPDLFAKRSSTGAYNIDQLTYADIQKLNARSRTATGYATPGNGYYTAADVFPVATFREVLDYAYEVYVTTGRVVGVYPEIKTITGAGAAAYHIQMADAMVAMLADSKYDGYFDGSLANVFLQSFDGAVVQYLNGITHLPIVFLTACPATDAAAQTIATFADGVGISRTAAASSVACVARAHAAGLIVHVYTLLSDPAHHAQVHGWGVDGVFGNHPDVAKAGRDAVYPLTPVGFRPPVRDGLVTAPGAPAPLADDSTSWHVARSGSTVPLKFGVYDEGTGAELVTLIGAVETVRVFSIPGCSGPAGAELPYPSLSSGDAGLRYDPAAGYFMLNWKTPRVAGDACYRVTMTARDGTALHAFIQARR
jgi:glycerophosphoryl diester phosphodiesterase